MTAVLELSVHHIVTVEAELIPANGSPAERKDLGRLNLRQANALTVELDAECGTDILAGVEGFNAVTFAQITPGLEGLEGYTSADLTTSWIFDGITALVADPAFSPESTIRFRLN